jgi:hypothetical protein
MGEIVPVEGALESSAVNLQPSPPLWRLCLLSPHAPRHMDFFDTAPGERPDTRKAQAAQARVVLAIGGRGGGGGGGDSMQSRHRAPPATAASQKIPWI